MPDDMVGCTVEDTQDLGWYPLPLDGESWPSVEVPGGIARVLSERPR